MAASDKQRKRRYDASGRRAAAEQRRLTVVAAARAVFEANGWAGTSMRQISDAAGVSLKMVEAVFGTKADLLREAVDYAIRGDVDALPISQRATARAIEQARDAAEMLHLHAGHIRTINSRSAPIAAVVEHAANADPTIGELWRTMNHNRAYGVRWATETLLGKQGRRPRLRRTHVQAVFWVALDWGTYRTLTRYAGLTDNAYEAWLRAYYSATLLPN